MGKAKFKMSVKDISFEFEGDVDIGRRIQTDITKSLVALTHAQTRLLPLDPNIIDAEQVKPIEITKSRSNRGRRSKEKAPRNLIVGLRAAGFFDQKRDIGAVQAELAKKGHTFKQNGLSSALIALCQQNVLKRDKNEGGTYEYERGEANVDLGSSEDAE